MILATGAMAQTGTDADVKAAVQSFLRDAGEGARLPLADVTDFDWDLVFAVPGAASDDIYRAYLGQGAAIPGYIRDRLDADHMLLVFVGNDGTVNNYTLLGPPLRFAPVTIGLLGRNAVLLSTPGGLELRAASD